MEVESLSTRWIENSGGYAARGKIIFKETHGKAVEQKVPINIIGIKYICSLCSY